MRSKRPWTGRCLKRSSLSRTESSMWWCEMRFGMGVPRLVRLAAPFAAACLLAGCFQPLYGEHSIGGGPSIRAALGTVDVSQIPAANRSPEAPLAVGVRHALLLRP